jgi:hypothetical protein
MRNVNRFSIALSILTLVVAVALLADASDGWMRGIAVVLLVLAALGILRETRSARK